MKWLRSLVVLVRKLGRYVLVFLDFVLLFGFVSDIIYKCSCLNQKGWYNYDLKVGKGRKPLPSSEMQALVDEYSLGSPHRGTKLSKEEIVHRLLFPLINEGFKILEEGIASDPSDIDIIYLYGYGWPAWRGMVYLMFLLLLFKHYFSLFTVKHHH